MPYATSTDYQVRFSAQELLQLTDRDNDGVADAGVFDDAERDAESVIDGYLRVQYALPPSSVPPDLTLRTLQVTRYLLFKDHRPEAVTDDYKDAMTWCANVAKGLVKLDIDPPLAPSTQSDDALNSSTRGQHGRCGDYFGAL